MTFIDPRDFLMGLFSCEPISRRATFQMLLVLNEHQRCSPPSLQAFPATPQKAMHLPRGLYFTHNSRLLPEIDRFLVSPEG